ncbi:MAG: LamG-like jellyroll fold domain-containing protein [Candidatus Eisenbacteria bacterium]
MRLAPCRFRPFVAVLALVLALVPLPGSYARAEESPGRPWGAPEFTDPCEAEGRLDRALADDPDLAARRELFEALVREAQRKGIVPMRPMVAGPSFTIPIVVHIVHMGGPENISDLQVQSQIWALNRDFANSPGGPSPAVNTGIQFCLATQLPPASPVVWSSTPGITRTMSPETNHTYGVPASEVALKAIDYLPSNQYLNVWVVNNIAGGGGGVAGYATFPGTVPAALDGIVIRYTCFGANGTPYGGPYPALLPTNNLGKIMTHEVGHWLNLLHTFHGGCAVPGDQVSDTPPEAVCRTGCPTTALTSCTAVNDPIENFMDYTNDVCRFAFTAGQTTRMQTAISYWRSTLVGSQNLIDVGCPSGLNALISASRGQICAPDAITFTTPASGAGYTYAWSFPGGSPASATTQTAVTTYATPGVYPVTLTVTDGGPNSSTNSTTIYARACTPVTGACANWVLPANAAFDWTSGTPVPVSGRSVSGAEAASATSTAAGALRFYADGTRAMTSTNVVMPNGNGLLAGGSSHNGVLIVPRPGNSNQYFLFTVRMWEDGATANPMNYSVVDMTLNAGLGDIVSGQKNLLVTLPGSPNEMVEGMAAIPHCNGVDWWVITNGANTGSGKLYVTLVTSAGPVSSNSYAIGLPVPGTGLGSVVPSFDGNRIAVVASAAGVWPNNGMIAVYNFNRATGVPSTLLAPTNTWGGYSDAAFSPNGKLLYFTSYLGSVSKLKQLEIATAQVRDLIAGPWLAVKPGPDGLLYVAPNSATRLHCINYPDQFNTSNLNECGLNLNAIPLPAGSSTGPFGDLPNMPLQCSTVLPADFSYTITSCLTVNFSSPNCTGPWTWNFGDATSGSGATVSHTYAAPGTYTITLTVPGASPTTKSVTITLGLQPVSIAGPNTRCTAGQLNYSVVGPSGYTYTWAISGGSPATASGNNVDITFGVGGGTITLTVTDPVTGCTANVIKNVGPCPSCVTPPANMTAWYPLDEPAGTVANEIVFGSNGADVSGPVHATGKVVRARTMSGAGQYVQAADAANLNFGAGDFTIDAWVRTTTTTGIVPIVDKRLTDPETGYALYLKNGRIAMRVGDGVLADGTEYWSGTTPLVADGQWHHVAGVLKRSAPANGSRLYVDGVPVASFPAYGGLSLTNNKPLYIGAQAGYFGPVGYLAGAVDEVELFQRALTTAELNGLYMADALGKCKEFTWVPTSAAICRDQSELTLTMRVCNYTGTAQSYNISFAGLPIGGTCTANGPTSFTLLVSNPVTVPSGGCVNVPYKVGRPVGMPLYSTACYTVTATNTATATAIVNSASIYAARQWCNVVIGGPVGIGGSTTAARVTFQVSNTGELPAGTPYSVRLAPREGADPAEEPLVALNGLPPGEPVNGSFNLAPGEHTELQVDASFLEPRAFRDYDVILSLDDDGDGLLEDVATGGVSYGRDASTVDVPVTEEAPTALQLAVTPNPVRGGATLHYALPERGVVELTVFDVAGRQAVAIRPFVAGAGRGALSLDCRSLARGVYFVRMRVNGRVIGQRFMLLE